MSSQRLQAVRSRPGSPATARTRRLGNGPATARARSGILAALTSGRNRRRRASRTTLVAARPALKLGDRCLAAASASWSACRGLLLGAVKHGVILGLLGSLVYGGYWGYRRLATAPYLTVRAIEIEGVEHADRAQLLAQLDWLKGHSIIRLPHTRLRAQLRRHPWIVDVRIRRALPDTVRIQAIEHEVRAAVLMGHFYLVDARGEVFKRAILQEAEALPVITGIGRLEYLNGEGAVRKRILRALAALELYGRQPRPPVGEVHVGKDGAVSLFLRRGGTAIKLGNEATAAKLERLDAVLAALGPDLQRARAVYLDHEKSKERVVVRMASYD